MKKKKNSNRNVAVIMTIEYMKSSKKMPSYMILLCHENRGDFIVILEDETIFEKSAINRSNKSRLITDFDN
jgi:hypothetical protein